MLLRYADNTMRWNPTRAFTLIELLVVIGIIALLLALLLPVLAHARRTSRASVCAAQLRELGKAMNLYANDNGGYVPRDYTPQRPDRRPYWMVLVGPYIQQRDDWDSAIDPAAAAKIIPQVPTFHCPEYELSDPDAGTYVMNSFTFESAPDWEPTGPTKLSAVRNGSGVVWMTEVVQFLDRPDSLARDLTIVMYNHDIFDPMQLPGGALQVITDDAHVDYSNVLHFDGSVGRVRVGGFSLEMFDDGIRNRRDVSIHRPAPERIQ